MTSYNWNEMTMKRNVRMPFGMAFFVRLVKNLYLRFDNFCVGPFTFETFEHRPDELFPVSLTGL